MSRLHEKLLPLQLSARFATEEEIPNIVYFMNRVRERTVHLELEDDIVSTDPDLLLFKELYNGIPHSTGELLLIHDDVKLVGTTGYALLSPDKAELRKLYLDDSLRGKGIGYALSQYIVARVTELKLSTLQLETNTRMTDAIRLYLKLGFQILDPPKEGGYVDVLMEKSLP